MIFPMARTLPSGQIMRQVTTTPSPGMAVAETRKPLSSGRGSGVGCRPALTAGRVDRVGPDRRSSRRPRDCVDARPPITAVKSQEAADCPASVNEGRVGEEPSSRANADRGPRFQPEPGDARPASTATRPVRGHHERRVRIAVEAVGHARDLVGETRPGPGVVQVRVAASLAECRTPSTGAPRLCASPGPGHAYEDRHCPGDQRARPTTHPREPPKLNPSTSPTGA